MLSVKRTRVAQQKKLLDLGLLDLFYYKFDIIVKVEFFKEYMDATNVDDTSLSLAIHCSRNQWKKYELLIDAFYATFIIEELILISIIVICLMLRKKRGFRILVGHPQD